MLVPRVLARVAALVALVVACDPDAFQVRLQQVVGKQGERAHRQSDREAQKAKGGRQALARPIARALDQVAASDAEFLVRKGPGKVRRYSGYDFASMLTTKSLWLGRDIDDFDTWITEIASTSFFGGEHYRVRRPDGIEEPFRTWIERQLARVEAQEAP